MMKVIGLAGRAGSGKSTIARYLAHNPGIEWIDLDSVAWRTYARGTALYDRLIEAFGDDILGGDGDINRKHLARRAFATQQSQQTLNELVHPAVSEAVASIVRAHEAGGTNVLLIEGALLATSPYVDRSIYHAILWLETSDNTQRQRLLAMGRSEHAERGRDVIPECEVVIVSGEGSVEDVAERVLQAIADVSG